MEFAKEKEVCLPARVNHWREVDILRTSLNNNTCARSQGLQISQGSGNPYYGQRTHVAGEFNRETGWTSLTHLFCTHEMTEVVDVERILQRSHQRAHCWKTAAYKSGAGSLYSENSSRRKISVLEPVRDSDDVVVVSSTTKTHPGQLVCSDCSTDAAYPERSEGIIILLWRSL